jgi:hypothetical protein
MAAGLGIAAGAFAENYARALGLRSQLDDAEKKREAMGLQMENQRLQNAQLQEQRDANQAAVDLEKNWSSGTGFRPDGADQNYDHRSDPAAVSKYYDNLRSVMRRQASAYGRSQVEADEAVDRVVKSQLAEKTGKTIQMLKMSPERATSAIKSAYEAFPDGGSISNVTYDKAKDAYIMTGVGPDGTQGSVERSRSDVIEALSFGALNGRDASALHISMLEKERARAFESGQLDKKIAADKDNVATKVQGDKDVAGMNIQGRKDVANIEGGYGINIANIRANAAGREAATAQQNQLLNRQLGAVRQGFEAVIKQDIDTAAKQNSRWEMMPQEARQKIMDDIENKVAESRQVGEANVYLGGSLDARTIHRAYTQTRDPQQAQELFARDDNGKLRLKRDEATGQIFALTKSGVYVPAPNGARFTLPGTK